jgi:hypothetical protein
LVVVAGESPTQVERAFRSMKTVHLTVRRVVIQTEQRRRGHVFLRGRACCVQ